MPPQRTDFSRKNYPSAFTMRVRIIENKLPDAALLHSGRQIFRMKTEAREGPFVLIPHRKCLEALLPFVQAGAGRSTLTQPRRGSAT